MNFQCTTAAFTLSPVPGGLRHLVLTRPGTGPAMRFPSVGSHLCARAPSRQTSRTCPCRRLAISLAPWDITGRLTGDFHPISSCPCRAYTNASCQTGFPLRSKPAANTSVGRRGSAYYLPNQRRHHMFHRSIRLLGTLAIAASLLSPAVHARNCQKIGEQVFCDDGTSYQRFGNQTFGSDGSSSTRIGNQRFNSDGSSSTDIGNQRFRSDGSSSQRIGNRIFNSDGTRCQIIGNQSFCN